MKNQFIKNKLNNQPKKVEKKKMSKSQVITFILMIFWTISSLVSWFALFSNSAASSGSNVLTAYADEVQEEVSTYDTTVNDRVSVDFTDTRYQNILYLGLNENYINSSADLTFNADGSFNFSCDDNQLLGYYPILTTNDTSLNEEFVEIFFDTIAYRTNSSGSPVPIMFYNYVEHYVTPNDTPSFGLNFVSSNGNSQFVYPMVSGVLYNITDYVSEDILQNLTRIDLEIYLSRGSTLDFFCLPCLFFGNTMTAVRSYSPFYYLDKGIDIGYKNGFEDGIADLGNFDLSILSSLAYDLELVIEGVDPEYTWDDLEVTLNDVQVDYPLSIDLKTGFIDFPIFSNEVITINGNTYNLHNCKSIVVQLRFPISFDINNYSVFAYYPYYNDNENYRTFLFDAVVANKFLGQERYDINKGLGVRLTTSNVSVDINSLSLIFVAFHSELDDYNPILYLNEFRLQFMSSYNYGLINSAYSRGYNQGFDYAVGNDVYSFNDLITAVIDTPVKTLKGLLNFNIPVLDINLYNLATSLITLALIVFIIRMVL